MRLKSTLTFLTCSAIAAFALLAPNVCEAANVSVKVVSGKKITSSTNKKGYVLLKWNAISGATKYGILRSTSTSLNMSNLKKMKFLKTFSKSTRSYKDKSAKLGYKYYYWYGALVGGTLYYCPMPATGRRAMDAACSIKKYSDGKNWLKLTVNGQAVTKAGVKYTASASGDWSFVKSEKSDGRVGYFNFKKKSGGRGTIKVKIGKTFVQNFSKTFNW